MWLAFIPHLWLAVWRPSTSCLSPLPDTPKNTSTSLLHAQSGSEGGNANAAFLYISLHHMVLMSTCLLEHASAARCNMLLFERQQRLHALHIRKTNRLIHVNGRVLVSDWKHTSKLCVQGIRWIQVHQKYSKTSCGNSHTKQNTQETQLVWFRNLNKVQVKYLKKKYVFRWYVILYKWSHELLIWPHMTFSFASVIITTVTRDSSDAVKLRLGCFASAV